MELLTLPFRQTGGVRAFAKIAGRTESPPARRVRRNYTTCRRELHITRFPVATAKLVHSVSLTVSILSDKYHIGTQQSQERETINESGNLISPNDPFQEHRYCIRT